MIAAHTQYKKDEELNSFFPLRVSLDYIKIKDAPIVVNKKEIEKKSKRNRELIKSGYAVSKKLGLYKMYFYSPCNIKRTRAIRILGKGDLEKGYYKMEEWKGKVVEEFHELYKAIKYKRKLLAFDKTIASGKAPVTQVRSKLVKYGLTRFDKMLTVHYYNKRMEQFLEGMR